ncbi:hypothetical protein D049_4423A, partial [Vibrio parahaemolyticus VPTS-2010]
MAVQLQL